MSNIAGIRWGTLQDAAEITGLSSKTIRRYITAGTIDARRFGPRAIRVNLSSLDNIARPLHYLGGGAA